MRNILVFVKGLLAGLLFLAGSFTTLAAEEEPFDLRDGFSHVAQKTIPAVVFIQVEKQIQGVQTGPFSLSPHDFFGEEFMERFFGQRMPQRPQRPGSRSRPYVQTGQGSGFIISEDGYILTNTHVIDGADKITVRLNNGKEYRARHVGADDRTEVAVIKIDAEDLPTVRLGDATSLKIGEWVIAIGNPFGLSETLTVGVVSALGRNNMGIADYEDFIQTDAAINPGNSGGPLLNIDGEVVGINTAIFSRSGGYMGIGFAVPIDMAVNIKEQLIRDGKVTRGYLGIAMNPGEVDEDVARNFGLDSAGGVLVAEVMPDGAAAKAGLKVGDIIRELNGEKVSDSARFRSAIAGLRPGTTAKLKVWREGKYIEVKARLDALPEEGSSQTDEPTVLDEDLSETLGFEARDADAALLRQQGFEDREQGVIISHVSPMSPAYRAGLRPGLLILSVQRHEIHSVHDLKQALKPAMKEKIIRLRVATKDGTRFAFIKVE